MKKLLVLFLLSGSLASRAWSENQFHVGDVINLNVVGYEEELNGTYRVGAAGMLEIPFIGRIVARDLTLDELRATLQERVWAYYINRPEVIVEPLFSITVLGHVYRPGPYHVDGGERLSGLLAMAGGAQDDANIKKTKVTRDGTTFNQNLKSALEASKTVNDIGIQSGDIIYVPKSSWWNNWQTWAAIISSVSLSVAVYDRVTN